MTLAAAPVARPKFPRISNAVHGLGRLVAGVVRGSAKTVVPLVSPVPKVLPIMAALTKAVALKYARELGLLLLVAVLTIVSANAAALGPFGTLIGGVAGLVLRELVARGVVPATPVAPVVAPANAPAPIVVQPGQ